MNLKSSSERDVWFYTPAYALTAALFRIALGIVALLSVSLFAGYLKEFFSNQGYLTSAVVKTFKSMGGGGNGLSIFFYSDQLWLVYFCYLILIASLILFIFGIYSQVCAFFAYLIYLSFYNRFPLIGFGGSEIIIMLLFFSIFLKSDQRLVPNWYKKLRGIKSKVIWIPGWPVRLIQINTVIIYFFAGVTKLRHSPWTEGYEIAGLLASYYSTINVYWIANYPILVKFMTYSSIVAELSAPFLIWFKQTRLIVLFLLFSMHFGIAFMINVTYFSEVMIASLLIFITKRDLVTIKKIYQSINMKKVFQYAINTIIILLISILVWDLWIKKKFWQLTNNSCDLGYVWVPGSKEFNTEPGFCVMQYEAKRLNGQIASIPQTIPWTNINQIEAKKACESIGPQYGLISDKEWVTIAYNVASTPINDIYPEEGLQLPVGNVNGLGKSLGLKPIDEPYTWGCDLSKPLYDQANRFRNYICEVRGKSNNLFYEKGYSGTKVSFLNTAKGYDAGKSADRSRIRTMVLSNGSVIWDFSGNVWEWVDGPILEEPATGKEKGIGFDSDGITKDLPLPKQNPTKTQFHFYENIVDWKGLDYLAPKDNLHCKNGIGKIYLDPGESWGAVDEQTKSQKTFVRGGAWANPTEAGILSLNISHAPSNRAAYIGFRCVKRVK